MGGGGSNIITIKTKGVICLSRYILAEVAKLQRE